MKKQFLLAVMVLSVGMMGASSAQALSLSGLLSGFKPSFRFGGTDQHTNYRQRSGRDSNVNSYNRYNSHNVQGDMKNNIMGDYAPTLGHRGGNSVFGRGGDVSGGGIQGNGNSLDMSIGSGAFLGIMGDQAGGDIMGSGSQKWAPTTNTSYSGYRR